MALKRINKEYNNLELHPNVVISIPEKNNMFHWKACITGPAETVYAGGTFYLDINFPPDYPFKPPKVRFTAPIYHPGIDSMGQTCLDILHDNWSPAINISKILTQIVYMLIDICPEEPLAFDIAMVYKENRVKFEQIAREWTLKYATDMD